MLINNVLNTIQTILKPVYDRSFFLKKIDWFIGINIFLVIFSSVFTGADGIGYFTLLAVIFSFIKLITKTGEKFEPKLTDILLLTYFIFVVISVAGSSMLILSLKGFFKTLMYMCFYLSVISFLKDNKGKIKWIFLAFAICASYETVFAFIQNFAAVEEISGWQDMSHLNPEEVMTRVYGTVQPFNPNLFGGYMLSIIPSFIALPFISKKLLPFSIIGCIAACIALIFTGCRGAYIGLFFVIIACLCILYKLLKPQFKKLFGLIASLGTTAIFFIILSVSSLRARIFSIFAMRNDSSNSFRFNVYNSCFDMFKDNWVLGIGCGNQNFREIYGLYMKTGFDALSAYNIYLEIAVESGIFALLSFICFLMITLLKAIKYIFSNNNTQTIYVLAALLSVIGILFHGFVDTVFFRPQIQLTFWIMMGILRVEL